MASNENQPADQDNQNPVGSGSQKLSQLLDKIELRYARSLADPYDTVACENSIRDLPLVVKALRRAVERFEAVYVAAGSLQLLARHKTELSAILGDRADVGEEKADLEEREA